MKNSSLRFMNASLAQTSFIEATQMRFYIEGWLMDNEIRDLSTNTISFRKIVSNNLLWFIDDRKFVTCGINEMRQFLMYLSVGHTDPRGRWGNPQNKKAVSRRTKMDYQNTLTTYWWWCVKQGIVQWNPMMLIDPVPHQDDQVLPFTTDEIERMLTAIASPRRNATSNKYSETARNKKKVDDPGLYSRTALRDAAIVRLIYDSGIRVSELCGITRKDLDLSNRCVRVLGKGRKERTVPFGKLAAKAIWDYVRYRPIEAEEPLFQSESGPRKGEALTRYAVRDMLDRVKAKAGIEGGGGAHKIRHSCATDTLRSGVEAFRIRELLGHTTMKMTQRYVHYTAADHKTLQRFSPGDKLQYRRLKPK